MIKDLSDFLDGLQEPLGTVVHLGAGVCREFAHYKRLEVGSLTLVEPNTDIHAQLQKKVGNQTHITLHKTAISTESLEHEELHVLNNFRFSSVKQPTKLMEHFPNLSVTESRTVPAQTLTNLIAQVPFAAGQKAMLVVDTPGMEWEILSTTSAATLHRFDQIVVRSSDIELYAGARTLLPGQRVPLPPDAALSALILREEIAPFVLCCLTRNDPEIAGLKTIKSQAKGGQELLSRLQTKEAALAHATKSQRELEAKLEQAESQIQVLGEKLKADTQVKQELGEQLNTLEAQAKEGQNLMSRLQTKEAALAHATKSQRELEVNLKQAESRIQVLGEKLSASTQVKQELGEQLNTLETQAKTNLQTTREAQAQSALTIVALEKQITEMQRANSGAKTERQQLLDQVAQLQTALATVESEQEEAQGKLKQQQQALDQRSRLLKEELRKAEVQIELITSVLFSDKD